MLQSKDGEVVRLPKGRGEIESSCGNGIDGHSKFGAGCTTSHFFLLMLTFRELQVPQRKMALSLSVF